MSDLKRQFREDRALRDAARSILGAQFTQVRLGLSGQRIGEKLADKIGDDALELFERTGKVAQKNGGLILALVGAVAAAVAWKPLAELVKSMGKSDPPGAGEAEALEEHGDDA